MSDRVPAMRAPVLWHDSRNPAFRRPFGAVEVGTAVFLRVSVQPDPEDADGRAEMPPVQLHLRYEAGTVRENSVLDAPDGCVTLQMLDRPGVYFYHFTCGGAQEEREHQITVFRRGLTVPDWFRHAVIYQIFPDRFCEGDGPVERKPDSFLYACKSDLPMYIRDADGNVVRWDFYGGNLWGVRDKLPYVQALGADTVYLNPIFESVSNHRYDTGDYKKVDGMLGGDDAFAALMQDCRRQGVHVILDGVFSHTGAESIYFDRSGRRTAHLPPCERGAWQSPDSRYRAWYRFRDDGSYDCWWDVPALPNVREMEPSYLAYVVQDAESVIRHWMRYGISGWRLDVADELPDAFIAALRGAVEAENPEAVVFGEVWEDASNKVSYGERRTYFTQRELHSCTNYPFREALLDFFGGRADGAQTAERFLTLRENYPRAHFYAQVNMTGSHDVKRLYTCMLEIAGGTVRAARALVQAYALIQFTFPGVPLVYYGDETCMEGETDPDNRRFYPWEHPDAEMIAWFSDLAAVRRRETALTDGAWLPFATGDADVFAFLRAESGKMFLTAVDRAGRGANFLLRLLEKRWKKDYTIVKQAAGYGVLLMASGRMEDELHEMPFL